VLAKQVLSQLSYTPTFTFTSQFKAFAAPPLAKRSAIPVSRHYPVCAAIEMARTFLGNTRAQGAATPRQTARRPTVQICFSRDLNEQGRL
jgi:hypothetical protein